MVPEIRISLDNTTNKDIGHTNSFFLAKRDLFISIHHLAKNLNYTKSEIKETKKYNNNSKWIEGKVEGIGSNTLLISKDESQLRLQTFMTMITVIVLIISTIFMIETFVIVSNITEPIVLQPIGRYCCRISLCFKKKWPG